MARLIEELKQEHVAIEALLSRVRDPKINTKDARLILVEAQSGLLLHLKKEDALLYPVLHKAALKDATLSRTVELYAKDMEEITSNAVTFFDKYSSEDTVIDVEFATALGTLIATVSQRMRKEESTLYQLYEKMMP